MTWAFLAASSPSLAKLTGDCHLSSCQCCSRPAGKDQPDLAAAALEAIFKDKQKLHRITLCTPDLEGNSQYTQYDMWPVVDHTPGRAAPALLVSTLNVTHQQMLELQLESARDQLQR